MAERRERGPELEHTRDARTHAHVARDATRQGPGASRVVILADPGGVGALLTGGFAGAEDRTDARTDGQTINGRTIYNGGTINGRTINGRTGDQRPMGDQQSYTYTHIHLTHL